MKMFDSATASTHIGNILLIWNGGLIKKAYEFKKFQASSDDHPVRN